jgi:hypothetical protein
MTFPSIFFCLNVIMMSHLVPINTSPVELFWYLRLFLTALCSVVHDHACLLRAAVWSVHQKGRKESALRLPYDANLTWQSAIYTLIVLDISTGCFILLYVCNLQSRYFDWRMNMGQCTSMCYAQIVPGQDLFFHSKSSTSSSSSNDDDNDDDTYLPISVVLFCGSVIGTLHSEPSDLPPFNALTEVHYWKLRACLTFWFDSWWHN